MEFGGKKPSSSIWICERMIFSESCIVLGSVQLTLTCFQLRFVDSLKHLHRMSKRSRKSNSNFFAVNLPKERSFRKIFSFRHCPNVYLFSSMVFGSNSPFIKKLVQFRGYIVSCLMWFCEEGTTILSYNERYFYEVLSFSPLLDECCFVFNYGFWEYPNLYTKCLIEIWAVIINSLTWICERTIFSTVFMFSALPGDRSTVISIWFWDRRTLFIHY